MSQYLTPLAVPPELAGLIDPEAGFLCLTTHWRPDPQAPDPEMPGRKLTMSSYLPASPTQPCLCGSGKRYRACCQRQRLWRPICPNPGGRGYRLVESQAATFRPVDGRAIREQLSADRRLRCVDRSSASSFWLWWGEPPVEDQYGILCFGDLELKENHTLVVSAMSDVRMRGLLEVLGEIVGDGLGAPLWRRDGTLAIAKRARPTTAPAPKRPLRRSGRQR
jgi:hypothetical protein